MVRPVLDRTCICGRPLTTQVVADQNGVPYPTNAAGATVIPAYGPHPITQLVAAPLGPQGQNQSPWTLTQPDPVGQPEQWQITWAATQQGSQLLAADGVTVLFESPTGVPLSINGAQDGSPTSVSGIRSTFGGTLGLAPTVILDVSPTEPPGWWEIDANGQIVGREGTLAERPAPGPGLWYFNTDLNQPEWSDGVAWYTVGQGGGAGQAQATLVIDEHFQFASGQTPSGLTDQWEQYDSAGNAGFGTRSPSQLQVDPTGRGGQGVLRITAQDDPANPGTILSGGTKLVGTGATDGAFAFGPGSRWEATMRVDADPDLGTSGLALLWPRSQNWPDDGETDWVEGFSERATRQPVESFFHWPQSPGVDSFGEYRHLGITALDWHVYTLEWTLDNQLYVQVDDGPWVPLYSTVEEFGWTNALFNRTFDNTRPTPLPTAPKEVAFQLDAWANVTLTAPLVLEVDRLRIWTLA